jgi:transposase-like protein
MDRIHGLFEKHARTFRGKPLFEETFSKPSTRTDFSVTKYTPEKRASVENMLRGGLPPLKVAEATGIKYNTVLRWSWRMGLKWPKGRPRIHAKAA